MQRYFVSKEEFDNNIIINDAFHIIKVMRSKINQKIIVCYNNQAFLSTIVDITDNVYFEKNKLLESNELTTKITLLQAIPKGEKIENIIMHSTELGVYSIYLSNFIRSIARIDEKKKDNKLIRFNKIAKEAAEQSHRSLIPPVEIVDYKKIDYSQYDLLILLDEEEAKKEVSLSLKKVYNNQKNILFVVGPEGGIDNKEREFFKKNNFVFLSLGKLILRTQTASLSFLAKLQFCGEE